MEPRPLEFRFKALSQLIGTKPNGVRPSTKEIKILCEKETNEAASSYHTRYFPSDVRLARENLGTLHGKGFVRPKNDQRKLPVGFPPVVAFRISKGGTGKTTVSANVGVASALLGYRILLLDADPQGTLSTLMGMDTDSADVVPLSNVLENNTPIDEAVTQCYANTALDLIPADQTMWLYESKLLNTTNREGILLRYLRKNAEYIMANYDMIIVDTNPGLPLLNMAISYAADMIVPVVMLDGMSPKAMDTLSANLYELREAFEHTPQVLMVVNGYHPTFTHIKNNLAALASQYRNLMSEIIISQYAGFSRQIDLTEPNNNNPLIVKEIYSPAAASMLGLASDILIRLGVMPSFQE